LSPENGATMRAGGSSSAAITEVAAGDITMTDSIVKMEIRFVEWAVLAFPSRSFQEQHGA
jgi:hypothetical protein